MKKYFFYNAFALLTAFFFSNTLFAQSTNERYQALNDYLETIIKDTTQVIYIAKEKINSNETLKVFKLNDIMIIDSNGNGKGDTTLYKTKDFKVMEKKYQNNCIPGRLQWCKVDYWKIENFKYRKISLQSMNSPKAIDKAIELMLDKNYVRDIIVHGFSEPIYYQNKKYIIFTKDRSGLNSYHSNLIVMEKRKGKWIVTHKGEDPNVMN
jgi:hypothetical protein